MKGEEKGINPPPPTLALLENLSTVLNRGFHPQKKVGGGTSTTLSLWSNSMRAAVYSKWKFTSMNQNV